MKVQRLIEKYKKLEGVWDGPGAETARQIFLQDLEQLDEPEKVKVSEEEAKFLETFDFDRAPDITKALYYVSRAGWGHQITDNNNVEMRDLTEAVVFFVKNRKRLIRAILDGYEVEEEKRYYVRLKSVDENYNYLNYIKHLAAWRLTEIKTDKKFRTTHTRKQLEDGGFGEAFNSPLFEVEEVEE